MRLGSKMKDIELKFILNLLLKSSISFRINLNDLKHKILCICTIWRSIISQKLIRMHLEEINSSIKEEVDMEVIIEGDIKEVEEEVVEIIITKEHVGLKIIDQD